MMLGVQIFGVLFGLFMIYITFLNRKRRQFTAKENLVWITIWILFIYVTVLPHSLDFIVKDVLSFSRTMDFFIVLGFMFLAGIQFYNYTLLRGNQKKIEEIVKKIAFEKAIKPKPGKK